MEFKVNCGIWGAMFGVPSIVADNFLKLASGNQIKVLLYLLRCSGKLCSTEEISANTGVPADEAEEAVIFWQQANVLSPQANIGSASVKSILPQQTEVKTVQTPPQPPAKSSAEPMPDHKTNLSGSEIAAIMDGSQDIRELFKIAESILGALKNSQMNSMIWMYDHLGLKKEVIITLISYCASIEKINTAYMEKIASVWAENDINTINAAQDEIQRMNASKEYSAKIAKLFQMQSRPTTKQNEFIQQWKNAGISLDLIRLAYEKTIEQINKLNFNYINKILLSWQDSGFKTVQDVEASESEYKKKRSGVRKDANDPDIEQYESVINKFLY
ncbi:DnaD domain protein [Ruminococcus sp.]|uniref:DnaD domain protein n=1 Tax=Ruminococcus sp. TaxID=41978 RepID=UPI0025E1148D|nr:DnaD domain protein [Ruminococcus sp.]MBQ6034436.1 DnaD domain protein [Ruminococcus sp.]MBQ6251242.1 DnaD domain protein [Ruminococcus sp.]MBR0512137.1 DnaD domain protein [Ruminococcus sp.]